ncbi:MAG TPA: hypothetical protein VGB65_12375 [Allosphingosinicella sp.]
MSDDIMAYSEQCTPFQLKKNDYLCIVEDASGAQIWIGLKKGADGQMEMAAVNPALRGEGTTDVVVSADVSPVQWKPFENAILVRFGAEKVPFVVDLADPRELPRFTPDAKLTVDLTAFADALTLHESEAAYYASQSGREIKFSADHFIPSGMFAGGAKDEEGPTAHAAFAGKILKAALRQNGTGKGSYWWMLVETFGGARINVVADPAMVKAPPRVGGHLEGEFWISGRLAKK